MPIINGKPIDRAYERALCEPVHIQLHDIDIDDRWSSTSEDIVTMDTVSSDGGSTIYVEDLSSTPRRGK